MTSPVVRAIIGLGRPLRGAAPRSLIRADQQSNGHLDQQRSLLRILAASQGFKLAGLRNEGNLPLLKTRVVDKHIHPMHTDVMPCK